MFSLETEIVYMKRNFEIIRVVIISFIWVCWSGEKALKKKNIILSF